VLVRTSLKAARLAKRKTVAPSGRQRPVRIRQGGKEASHETEAREWPGALQVNDAAFGRSSTKPGAL
jgi:hypothetical protein